MSTSPYALLEKFAAGDAETLDQFVDDHHVFITILEQACARKKDESEIQYTLQTDPEKFFLGDDMDMYLMRGIEKLVAHINDRPKPWTTFQNIQEKWRRFTSRLEDDEVSERSGKSFMDRAEYAAKHIYEDLNHRGKRISTDTMHDLSICFETQIYETHMDFFKGLQPHHETVDFTMRVRLERYPHYPKHILETEVRKDSIVAENIQRIVDEQARAETGPTPPDPTPM